MEHLIEKSFEANIVIRERRFFFFHRYRKITLHFEREASTQKALEFIHLLDEGSDKIYYYVKSLIEEGAGRLIPERDYKKDFWSNPDWAVEVLKGTIFSSIWQDKKIIDEKQEETEKTQKSLEDQIGEMVAFLSKPMALHPKEILKTYTFKELNFWTRKYIREENKKTPEGQKENQRLDNLDYIESVKPEVEKSLELIDLFYKKQKAWASKKH